jgi:5,5'-dehydrodivanillate O-demethylase oxygenase subunit
LLTAARNEMLTRVGPGTPMGELLRRYWQPVGGASELDTDPIKPIRLLGEDLVLYRDGGGRYGLIDRHCPHRCADMAYGWVEERGIRCSYHGWLIDEAGRCIEQPYEDTASPKPSKSGCDAKAYPVKECAGLLFAYLGPLPAPELPVWEPFTWPNGFREIVLADVPCNWFQCQENSIDPVHFEWMHDNWANRQRGGDANAAPKHLKLRFEEFEHGFVYKRVREWPERRGPLLDRRACRAVAERLLSRQPFRVARAGRRREYAERGVVFCARAEGPGALSAGTHSHLGESTPR